MRLENINIEYSREKIITDLSLDIDSGEIFVLMGPSGGGKTTLLKAISGLIPISSGALSWEEGKKIAGLVFQEPRLFPHLTVRENIAFSLRVKGVSRKKRQEQADEFIKILQLEDLENRFPHQLSGGQQQRVSLGRTLILKPDLLLLDEPFASLDPSLRMELIDWLYQFQRKNGFSIIWVTHFLDEAFSVADRMGIIIDGQIQQVGRPTELYQKPSSEKIASFLSLPNRFSKEQWQKWFPFDLSNLSLKARGWIPANGLQLIDKKHISKEIRDDKLLGLALGIVTKTIPGNEGFSVIVKADDCLLEISNIDWNSTPKINDEVCIGVPFERIFWYNR